MPSAHLDAVLRHLRRLVHAEAAADLTDGELLSRFINRREEAAFTLLLLRHGPMVLSVCRRILHDRDSTEDAFQATFVVLARRAGSIRRRDSLASWLYGVALRVARRVRAQASARCHHERLAAAMAKREPDKEPTWDELREVLDEEIAALPEKYRAPLVLHYLEGKTQAKTASALRCPRSTVRDRLEQGRELLRERLVRRGVTLTGGTLAATLAQQAAPAAVPATLTLAAVRAAMGGTLSAPAAAIVQEVVYALGASKLKGLACAILLLGIAIGGTISAAHQLLPDSVEHERHTAQGPKPQPVQPKATARSDIYGDPLPDGAISRMGSTRLVHYMASELTISPNGKVVATGGMHEIRLWDRATGKLLREFRDGKRTMDCVPQFSPDGSKLVGAGMHVTSIWDVASGKLVCEFPHSGQMATWSPNGEFLAITSKDGVVHVHETRTRKQVAEFDDAKDSLQNAFGICIAFSPDGKTLMTVAGLKACRWDLARQKLLRALDLPTGYSWFYSFPDRQTAVVFPVDRRPPQGGNSQEPLAIWDMTSNQAPRKLQGDMARKGTCFAVSHDGKTLALNATSPWEQADEDVIGLWDVQSRKLRRTLRIPTRFSSLEFSSDDRTLMIGVGAALRLWDIQTAKEVLQRPTHYASIRALAFTPDGKSLVSGSENRSVRLWDVASGRQLREFASHRWRCDSVAVTPDGSAILSGGYDGCLLVQDREGKVLQRMLVDGPPEKQAKPSYGIQAIAITADGKKAATYGSDPDRSLTRYHVWDLVRGKQLNSYPCTAGEIPVPDYSSDARLVLEDVYEPNAGVHTGVLLREVASGKELLRLSYPDRLGIGPRALAPDGRSVLLGTGRQDESGRYESTYRLYEVTSGKERLTFSYGPSKNAIGFPVFAPNGRLLANKDSDGTLLFWDLRTGKQLPDRLMPSPSAPDEIRDQIYSLAFSHDSRLLATGRRDGTILVWKMPSVPRATKAEARQLEQWWADLASEDARRAYRAICELSEQPAAITIFRERLKPATEPPLEPIRKLIADLDSQQFARRNAAKKELVALDEQAAPALCAALQGAISEEQRRRIEQMLSALEIVRSPERLRHLRALEVLERIGTPDAERVIRSLATGLPEARVTRDAKATVERLAMRSAWRR
jgi:RNA polymerase sigma factor (sigma-70 family)